MHDYTHIQTATAAAAQSSIFNFPDSVKSQTVLKKHVIAMSQKPLTFEEIKEQLSKGKQQPCSFSPNLNFDKVTKCYKRAVKGAMRSKSGLIHFPNKSEKINKMQTTPHSQILAREKPLGLETKPVSGLKGTLWNEMVEIEKQQKKTKKPNTKS